VSTSVTLVVVNNEELLTIEEVADRLKVSKMTVYRYIKSGKLMAYKLEQELRVKVIDLDIFLDKRKLKV
jgi:putative molybdopterin biosynthesis protein